MTSAPVPVGRFTGPVVDVAETLSTRHVGELLDLPGVLAPAPLAAAVVLRGLDGEARVAVVTGTRADGCTVVLGPEVDRDELHAHGLTWVGRSAPDQHLVVCP